MKKFFLTLIGISLIYLNVFAQCAKIDSLRRVAYLSQKVEDKINALNQLSAELIPLRSGGGLLYAKQAQRIAEANHYKKGIADALVNIATVNYLEELSYEEAAADYLKSIEIYRELGLKKETAQTFEILGDFYHKLFYIKEENYKLALESYQKALAIRKELGDHAKMADIYDQMGEIYSDLGENRPALDQFMKAVESREKTSSNSSNDSRLLSKAKRIYELEVDRQRFRNYTLIFLLAFLLSLVLFFALEMIRRKKAFSQIKAQKELIEKQNELIAEQKDIVDIEHKIKDNYSLLPETVYEEIKEKGTYAPRQHDLVSVLFSDLEDFTSISKGMSTQTLMEELNLCFGEFDKIITRRGLTKIKTLGDSYMCAGGIPEENKSNPIDVVLAALEMRDFVEVRRQTKLSHGEPYWRLRIGINTGYLLAGVVGYKKYAYDVWGETVNIAKLLELQASSGTISIAESTYHYVKDFFEIQDAGEINLKHKGSIRHYNVDQILSELSEEGDGIKPNRFFYLKKDDMLVSSTS